MGKSAVSTIAEQVIRLDGEISTAMLKEMPVNSLVIERVGSAEIHVSKVRVGYGEGFRVRMPAHGPFVNRQELREAMAVVRKLRAAIETKAVS